MDGHTEQPHSFSQLINFYLIPFFVEDAFNLQAYPESQRRPFIPAGERGGARFAPG